MFIKEDDTSLHRDCWLSESVVLPNPFTAILIGKHPRSITVVGLNGGDYHIEEIMSNGETSRSVVPKSKIRRS